MFQQSKRSLALSDSGLLDRTAIAGKVHPVGPLGQLMGARYQILVQFRELD